ncbi:probable ornithine carbamoyltransferase precursor [Serendipita indica DSM 11827]|uniref:ornithine carbamoyltransferase n=1 Tax=Serendipita indica (strain DSM 11827) TaxID=1109443 RepID=G4TF11_SERID|nr:probable ornithine carbamoyltransferase precursor [Serendipita indica DSM 11827]
MIKPPHLMTLADLNVNQIQNVLTHALRLKNTSTAYLAPGSPRPINSRLVRGVPPQSLSHSSIALLFSKRSTRTRVSAETAAVLLGGRALFLGREDIQLGVNESARDTARVLGGMCQGIFARVGDHSEIEELAEHSPVPVINALSSLWHPTQILADLLTLHEEASFQVGQPIKAKTAFAVLPEIKPLTITYLGDSTNVLHDMLVTFPRLGHKMQVATPNDPQYRCPTPVWNRVKELGCDSGITWVEDPREAVKDADVVITDTWISMGQEAEKEQRLKAFQGYQVTEQLCREGGAKPDWKFLHCLPRKKDEVDDEVFYGPRSLVFPEADNRKWTIMALFDMLFGHWQIYDPKVIEQRQPKS